jgi:hypothetical protein
LPAQAADSATMQRRNAVRARSATAKIRSALNKNSERAVDDRYCMNQP